MTSQKNEFSEILGLIRFRRNVSKKKFTRKTWLFGALNSWYMDFEAQIVLY